MFNFFNGIVKAIGGAIVSLGVFITGGSTPVDVEITPVNVVVEATTTDEVLEEVDSPPQPVYQEPSAPPVETIKPVTVVDFCINIEGIQSGVPAGYTSVSNICTLIVRKDRCFNIEGIQEEIPGGLILTREIGCVTESEYDEHFDSQNPEPEPEPEPTYAEIRSKELEDEISRDLARDYARLIYENRNTWSHEDEVKLGVHLKEYGIYTSFYHSTPGSADTLKEFVNYWEAWLSNKYNKQIRIPVENYKD